MYGQETRMELYIIHLSGFIFTILAILISSGETTSPGLFGDVHENPPTEELRSVASARS